MSEYPSRSCGPCPHKGKYDKIAENLGDYLQNNTVPKPELLLQEKPAITEAHLGVPSATQPPDIEIPAIKSTNKISAPPAPQQKSNGLENMYNSVQKKASFCCCEQTSQNATKERCPDTGYALPKMSESGHMIPNCPENLETDPEHILQKLQKNKMNDPNQGNPSLAKMPERDMPQIGSLQGNVPLKGILKTTTKCPCASETPELAMLKSGAIDPKLPQPQQPQKPIGIDTKATVEPIKGKQPCYMPQPEDEYAENRDESMGPIGPWATGRVDWGALAGLTGTRPVVDKYSIARFSEGDWRRHNQETLSTVATELHRVNLTEWNARQALEQTRSDTDKNQEDSSKRLSQRERELQRWKCELERAIAAAAEEVSTMQEQRRRLKQSMAVMKLPESIAGECLERRTGRLDPELVRDVVEDELIKELALTAEIRDLFTRTLNDLEMQLLEDKTAKQRLEYDWSDKKQAHEIEIINVALNNRSNIMLFKPGATRFPDDQSSIEHWEKFTRQTLEESEQTRQRSVAFRGTLDAILLNAAKDMRTQADRVDMALSKRIACTEEIRDKLETELKAVLQRLADIENLILSLTAMIRRMDFPMKMAQTRLDNRVMNRPRVENCRDPAQYGLVEEVKSLNEGVSALRTQLKQAEECQTQLMLARSNLEREVMAKRKTLEIDRDRTQLIRTHYPSSTALSGH